MQYDLTIGEFVWRSVIHLGTIIRRIDIKEVNRIFDY
jgi:hypothetical protein